MSTEGAIVDNVVVYRVVAAKNAFLLGKKVDSLELADVCGKLCQRQ